MRLKTLKKNSTKDFITYGMVIVAFAIIQILSVTGNISYMISGLLVPVCAYIILAISLNITVGILGELSLGQAGFMCIGAYSSSLFSICTQETIQSAWIRFPLAILVGGIFAAIFGVLIGIPVLRLKGDYLAIVTLAFGEIIKNIFSSTYLGYDNSGLHFSLKSQSDLGLAADGKVLINGPLGLNGTPNDSTFVAGFVLIMITLIITLNFINSRTGRAVMAIRDNRIAAESIGINITKYKLIAFSLSAFLAGFGGALFSHNFATLQAMKFDYNTSILILVFVVLGGIGNIRGSIIAATILYILPEVLREISDYRMLFYAILLIVMMIFSSNPTIKGYRERFSTSTKSAFRKIFPKKKEVEE